jgi:serine/threonine-protein kinase
LRLVLRRLPRDAPLESYGTKVAHDVQLLYWQRQPDSLLHLLTTARAEAFDGQPFFWPKSLYAAWAHQLRGDRLQARAAFDSALALIDSVLRKLPDDWRVRAARGLALAGLGRSDEARREARWLEQSVVYRKDAFAGPLCAEARARVLAQAGDADAALDQIDRLLAKPAFFSIHSLRLDPLYDPIRNQPRFKALLAKYAER